MAKKKKKSGVKAWQVGAGITAAALAAATGAYLLSDKKMRKARTKKWAIAARKEVAKNAALAKKLGEREYKALVDQAVKRYGSLEEVSAADIIAAGKELRSQWRGIQAHAKKIAMRTTKTKKSKAVKKTSAKRRKLARKAKKSRA